MSNIYCSLLVIIMMLGLVVSDPPTPYPYYDESNNNNSPTVPPSFPNNSQSPNLVTKGRKNSPPQKPKPQSPPPKPKPRSAAPPPPPPAVHFDFFKLAERWPKTFCFTQTCRTDIQFKFEIHGLWPSIAAPSASQPKYCQKTKGVDFYNFEAPVLKELRTEWPSLIKDKTSQSNGDTDFWFEQWQKHGTCSSLNAKDYFKLTLAIHKRTILKDVLQKEGILPNYIKTLPTEKIFNATRDHIEAKPEILCTEYKNKYYVEEIRMCLDKTNDHKYMDCPRKYVNCPTDVYFP